MEKNIGRQKYYSDVSRVLVTGGLGFVGSELCHTLLKNKITLCVIDDESRGKINNITGLSLKYIKADIRDRNAVIKAFEDFGPEIVIHLAAMHFIPDCNRDPAVCLDVNVVGTENILEACRRQKSVRRVLVTSSMAVYPIKNGANLEAGPVAPYDVYGESKMINEFQAGRFQRETGIDTIAVRLSNVYGPRETNQHVIPEIMEQLKSGDNAIKLGNIEPMRDFLYTSDAAEGFTEVAFDPLPPGFHIVNLGSGKEYSIKQVLEELSKILGRPIESLRDPSRYRNVERMHLLTDITRINKLVGWRPRVELREGLKDLCRWYGLI